MKEHFIPKVQLPKEIQANKLNTLQQSMRIQGFDDSPEIPKFKDMVTGMVKEVDASVKAPDQVLQDALTGNSADVHDVIIAISKAELNVNIATQVTTKVVQAYQKVTSIQV